MFVAVDMDGVLTNLAKAIEKLGIMKSRALDFMYYQSNPFWVNEIRNKIEEAGSNFWSEMEWLNDGKKLWKFLKPFKPIIISSPSCFSYAAIGKTKWVDENLPGTKLILTKKKYNYTTPGSILIDDYDKYIKEWNQKGGIGILHINFEDTMKEFLKIISQNKRKGFGYGLRIF